jgi:hypothetical protein
MSDWPRAVLLAIGLMVGSWALLVLLARRLPPGLLRDLAGFVPDGVTTIRRLRRDPRGRPGPRSWSSWPGCGCSPIDLLAGSSYR